MAWTIILENEEKKIITSLGSEFEINLVSNSQGFKLLCYLDVYGDTIFNRLQMDDLIHDLQNLKSIEKNALVDKIEALAERCKREPHTYLAFYGD